MIFVETRQDGIAVATIKSGDGPHNTLDKAFNERLLAVVKELAADEAVKGVVLASAKDTFAAGGDLDQLLSVRAPAEAAAIIAPFTAATRALETMGKPVVAALNGSALGGGYELALAAHRRIAADRRDARFGLPEAGLGLMPGAGGTQRLPRMIGLQPAGEMILAGKVLDPKEALAAGLVDAIVPGEALIEEAAAWALGNPGAQQPWDVKRFYLAEADPNTVANRAWVLGAWARQRSRSGRDDKAVTHILSALHHGLERSFDAGMAIETREFSKLAASPFARAKVRTLFYGPKAGQPKKDDTIAAKLKHLGVVGGGTMGNGIAFSAARAGLRVTLIDVSAQKAMEAQDRIKAIGERQVKRGRLSEDGLQDILGRLSTTHDYASLSDADFVIEAVFERLDVKHDVYGKLEAVLGPDVTVASNTSSILISELAKGFKDPSRMIGMHFFAPVEVMKLLEIIRTPETSERALAEAHVVAAALRKTQITVKDGKGFYTSRLVSSLTAETLTLLSEGVSPAVIDNTMIDMGFAVGSAMLVDLTKIPLLRDIMESMTGPGMPRSMEGTKTTEVLDKLLAAGREGRDATRGVYDYTPEGQKAWPGMAELFPPTEKTPGPDEVRTRLMNTQSLEAVRCIDEGVFDTPLGADIASVLGWGYPAHLGGPLGYIDVHGPAAIVAECDELAKRCGERFDVPESLRSKAQSGEGYYETSQQEKAA